MKVFIVLACVAVSCAAAGGIGGYGSGYGAAPSAGYASSGQSSQFRSEDNYGNYQFGYDESNAGGSSGRREERAGDVVRGSYRLNDADGRQRTVNYVADHSGFRATIHTNEPGVDAARDPADVLINKEGNQYAGQAYSAPAQTYSAPAPVQTYSAPVQTYSAPVQTYSAPAQTYSAPAPLYARSARPAYRAPVAAAAGYGASSYGAGPVYEAPAPRAFSYSFNSVHPSTSYAAPAPAYAAQAPTGQLYNDGPAY